MRSHPRSLVLILVLLTGACGSGSVELLPLVAPDTGGMEAPVREQLDAAERELRSAVAAASHPDLIGPKYGELGSLYLAYGLYAAAEPALRNAAHLQPDVYRWQHLLGHLYYDSGRTGEAAERFRAALELRPDSVPTLVTLGLLSLDIGEADSARQLGEQVRTLEVDNAAGFYLTGMAALLNAEYGEAATRLEQALARQPEADFTWNVLAQAYRGLGRTEEAEAALARGGGQQIGVRDDVRGALDDLRVGSEADLDRARNALATGRVDDAITYLRRVVELDPERNSAWLMLGLAYAEQGDMQRARTALGEVLERSPDHAPTMVYMGSTYAADGDEEQAIAWFKRGLERDPEVEDGDLNLANALQRNGACAEALVHFDRAIALAPADVRPRLGLATCLSALGDETGTLRALEKSAEELPDDPVLRRGLAWFLLNTAQADLRDPERALQLARDIVGAAPGPDTLATLALALAMTGDFNAAVGAQERAVQKAEQQGPDGARLAVLKRDLERLRNGQIPAGE